MSWHKLGTEFIKPTLKFTGTVIIPLTATAIIWNTLNNLVTVLAIILLVTLILKHWGVNVKIFNRFANTKIGKMLVIFIRSGSMVTKMNEEYFEETSEIIADQGKFLVEQGKKIKEEINLSKLTVYRKEAYVWLKHNKKQILGELLLILLGIDGIFGFSKKYGFPVEWYAYIASAIFVIAMIVLAGEGFTSNISNWLRENAIIARAEAHKKTKIYKIRLVEINKEADLILKKYGIEGILPESIKPDYVKLMSAKKEYEKKIQEILNEIESRTK